MNRARGRAGVAGSLLLGLAAFVLVPIGLLAVARFRFGSTNPLAGVPPPSRWSADAGRDALAEPLSDGVLSDVLIRASLCIGWLALAVVVVSTVAETAHMLRHGGLARPRVRGLGWAQSIARTIAVGVISVVPVTDRASAVPLTLSALTASAGSTDASPLAEDHSSALVRTDRSTTSGVDESSDPGVSGRRSVASNRSESTVMHEVRRGESVWSIATELADGDAELTLEIADSILDANLGHTMVDGDRFTSPALIRPGWRLVVPGGAAPFGAAQTPMDHAAGTDGSDRAEHLVQAGDTLSGIAEEHLGAADDWPLIFEANAGSTMSDGRTFDDPDLILPGWELRIPSVADETPPGAPAVADEPVAAEELPDGESPDDRDEPSDAVSQPEIEGSSDADESPPPSTPTSTSSATTGPPPVVAPTPVSAPPVATDPVATDPAATTASTAVPASGAATTTSTTAVPDAADGADSDALGGSETKSPAAPSPLGIEHAAMLAAGVLALVGLRRLQRLRRAAPRSRVPTPPADVVDTERALRAIEPGVGAARLDVALRAVGRQLAGTGSQVGFACVADDGAITLRLTEAAQLEEPWHGSDHDWELPSQVPIELLAEDARHAGQPCQAFVEVGRDEEGHMVLLDLEAAGVVAVEARPDVADEVVRAIAAGLATSPDAEVAQLALVGLDAGCLLEHPNARVVPSIADAVDVALAGDHVSVADPVRTFDRRVWRTGGEMWEPTIVLLGSGDDAARGLDLGCLPGSGAGVAVVASVGPGAFSDAGARIEAHADRWELLGFGTRLRIRPVGLDDDDLDRIAAIVADASTDPVPEPTAAETARVDHDRIDLPFQPRPHGIVVGLLGGVEIRSRDGELGSFERSKTVELIAWLATHRDRATRTAARTALWEIDVRDATFANVVSEARRALGRLVAPPDGEEWVGRTLTESLPLHDLVVTDADLVRDRLEHAELAAPSHAIDVLTPAVEMIREMPFAGTSYLWPDADGITSDLVLLATTVTAELAAHALSIGDIERVFWATGHGLRVLPGHEELIALRMRAHARAGDLAGVRAEWESYERVIVADSWSDGEPAPKLLDLRRELLSPTG